MGYNLIVACHTCEVEAGVLRGEEAEVIAKFAVLHPRSQGHRKEVRVDNGWSWPEDEFQGYRDTYDEVKAVELRGPGSTGAGLSPLTGRSGS